MMTEADGAADAPKPEVVAKEQQVDQQQSELWASGAVARQIGNRVLVLWKSDGYWYSGTVTNINKNRFNVKYGDGHQQ